MALPDDLGYLRAGACGARGTFEPIDFADPHARGCAETDDVGHRNICRLRQAYKPSHRGTAFEEGHMGVFAIWLIFAVIVGIGASGRGRSGFGWFLLAVVISPLLAVVLLFLLPPRKGVDAKSGLELQDTEDRVRCPECAELIQREAKVCRYCRHKLESPAPEVVY